LSRWSRNFWIGLLPRPLRAYLGPESRATFWLLVIRAAALLLTFATGILVARLFGAEGFGMYSFGMSVVSLLVIPASLGFDQLLVREVAVLRARDDLATLARLLGFVVLATTGLAVAVTALAWFVIRVAAPDPWVYATVVGLMLPSVVFISWNKLADGVLLGFHRPVLAALGQQIVRPVLLIGAVLVFYTTFAPALTADVQLGLAASLALGGAAAVSVVLALPVARRAMVGDAGVPGDGAERRLWSAAAVAFGLIQGAFLMRQNIDVLMLGFLSTPEQAGLCRAAQRLAELVFVVDHVLSTQFRAHYAAAHARGDLRALEARARTASTLACVGAVPVLVAFVVFGVPLLRLFGEEFGAGYYALLIFAGAQLSGIVVGQSLILLPMTGHARLSAIVLTAGLGVNVLANLWLAPLYGALGAAIANATSIGLTNLVMLVLVWRRLKINPCPFLPPRHRDSPPA